MSVPSTMMKKAGMKNQPRSRLFPPVKGMIMAVDTTSEVTR